MSKSSLDCYRNTKQTAGHAPPRAEAPGIPLPPAPQRSLESNIDFWAQHDISEIPSHLLARLSDLEGGHVISGDSIFQAQQIFINQLAAAKEIYGVSPIIFPGYVESTLAACQNGAKVHLIVTSPILEIMRTKTATAFEALQKIESFHLYEIDTAKVAFAIIDDVLSFGLYRLDGEYDATTDLGCPGERACTWGLDLFHHYLKKATAI